MRLVSEDGKVEIMWDGSVGTAQELVHHLKMLGIPGVLGGM